MENYLPTDFESIEFIKDKINNSIPLKIYPNQDEMSFCGKIYEIGDSKMTELRLYDDLILNGISEYIFKNWQ